MAVYPSSLGQINPLFVRINATADGTNTVITGTALKRILVLGYAFAVTAANVIDFRDDASTVYGSFQLAALGGVSYAGGLYAPAFVLPEGKNLVVNNATASSDTLGHLTYVLID